MDSTGRESVKVFVHGELHSTDASAGVEIVLYEEGSLTARTLGALEVLVIESVELVSAAGGDCSVIIGADATPGAGEYVLRGTFAANSGIQRSSMKKAGIRGHKPFLIAPIGVVDVIFNGYIR